LETDALYKSICMCADSDSAKFVVVAAANMQVPCTILFLLLRKSVLCFV